jgi:hypothetical protein
MLNCEELGPRVVPSVAFQFQFNGDGFFTAQVRATIEAAGRTIGGPLTGPTQVVRVDASETDPNTLARGAPGFMTINPNFPYHKGLTEAGLQNGQADLFTVVEHELVHELGFLTHLQGDHLMTPVLPFGRRVLPDDADWAALAGLGYDPHPPAPTWTVYSFSLPGGLLRDVYVSGSSFLVNDYRGPFRVLYADWNYDGTIDARFTQVGGGYDFVIDGRTGGLADPIAFDTGLPGVYRHDS